MIYGLAGRYSKYQNADPIEVRSAKAGKFRSLINFRLFKSPMKRYSDHKKSFQQKTNNYLLSELYRLNKTGIINDEEFVVLKKIVGGGTVKPELYERFEKLFFDKYGRIIIKRLKKKDKSTILLKLNMDFSLLFRK